MNTISYKPAPLQAVPRLTVADVVARYAPGTLFTYYSATFQNRTAAQVVKAFNDVAGVVRLADGMFFGVGYFYYKDGKEKKLDFPGFAFSAPGSEVTLTVGK